MLKKAVINRIKPHHNEYVQFVMVAVVVVGVVFLFVFGAREKCDQFFVRTFAIAFILFKLFFYSLQFRFVKNTNIFSYVSAWEWKWDLKQWSNLDSFIN